MSESDWEDMWDDPPPDHSIMPSFRAFPDISQDPTTQPLNRISESLPSELLYQLYVSLERFTFGFDEIEIRLTVDAQNRLEPITSYIENRGYVLSRKVIDDIRASLRCAIQKEAAANDTLDDSNIPEVVLRLVEGVYNKLLAYRHKDHNDKKKYWSLNAVKDLNPLLDRKLGMKGVDLDTVHGAATHILGKTPAQICNDILPKWRILHCENILRTDHANRFLNCQNNIRAKLMKAKMGELNKCVPIQHRRLGDGPAARDQLIEYLTKPRITFHGTRRGNVPSIVQHGLLKPGALHPVTKKPLGIDNGAAYGQGIYSSPDPAYALMYASGWTPQKGKTWDLPGYKLLICGVIMGRSAQLNQEDQWWERSEPYPGADSHVNPSQYAYIVFDSAQIVPCYVLHLDYTGDDSHGPNLSSLVQSRGGNTLSKNKWDGNVRLVEAPGDVQRKKAELIAKGQKFFAYGFGSLNGKQIVIEDVADVDDDDEDYGDYQRARIDANDSGTSIWDSSWGRERNEGDEDDDEPWDKYELPGVTDFDEFAGPRRAKVK